MVVNARRHVESITRHGGIGVDQAHFYEFGAGKELISSLVFYCFGAQDQVLVDIQRLAREDLVVDVLHRLCNGTVTGLDRTPTPGLAVDGLDQRLATLGIRYLAPCDARHTGLADGAIDYVTSTSTLEHIAEADIRLILRECRRILSSEGIISLIIDYQDHYSFADNLISAYNFLKYDDEQWTRWSPSLQFQNRLRHSDYVSMFLDEGFDIVHEETHAVSSDDLKLVRELPLASRFESYSERDLATRTALITLKRSARG